MEISSPRSHKKSERARGSEKVLLHPFRADLGNEKLFFPLVHHNIYMSIHLIRPVNLARAPAGVIWLSTQRVMLKSFQKFDPYWV
jgi:hypothetical protein